MKSSLLTIIGLFGIACNAMPSAKRDDTTDSTASNEYNIALTSETSFCSFMPPQAGDDVGGTETQAIPMCTMSNLGYQQFPTGFIKTANFVSTNTYSQITGTIDASAYGLSSSDGGGQYDNKDIKNAKCDGYKYFVNLIEPDTNTFCIRCCSSQSDCNLGISTHGCARIVPGSYD